jgi:hypothetical protein
MGYRDEFRAGQESAKIKGYPEALGRAALTGAAIVIAVEAPAPIWAKC